VFVTGPNMYYNVIEKLMEDTNYPTSFLNSSSDAYIENHKIIWDSKGVVNLQKSAGTTVHGVIHRIDIQFITGVLMNRGDVKMSDSIEVVDEGNDK